jgi:hypothetical protein
MRASTLPFSNIMGSESQTHASSGKNQLSLFGKNQLSLSGEQ